MWFDAYKALADIEAGGIGDFEGQPAATIATIATNEGQSSPHVAIVASVATPRPPKNDIADCTSTEDDMAAMADALRIHGPLSYGAAASLLGWGATRAWVAEARLRAAGLIRYDEIARACLAK